MKKAALSNTFLVNVTIIQIGIDVFFIFFKREQKKNEYGELKKKINIWFLVAY